MDELKKRQQFSGVVGDIYDCYFLDFSGPDVDEILARVSKNYLLTRDELEKLRDINLDLYLKNENIQKDVFDKVQLWLTQYAKSDYVEEHIEDIRNEIDERFDLTSGDISDMYDTIFGTNTALGKLEQALSTTNTTVDDLTTRTESMNIILNGLVEAVEQLQKNPPSNPGQTPDTPPTYKAPTISLGASKTSVELNVSTQITLTPVFNQYDAGDVISVKIYQDGTEISSDTEIKTVRVDVNKTTTFKLEISYAAGPIKNTSLGNPYPSTSIKEGTLTYEVKVTAIAASYYGVGTADIKVLKNSKAFTWDNINCYDDVLVYKYPKSFGKLTSIKDANNFEYINSYTYTEEDINNIIYSVYTLTDAMTVENAKQIYS